MTEATVAAHARKSTPVTPLLDPGAAAQPEAFTPAEALPPHESPSHPPAAEARAETSTLTFNFVARCAMQASTSVALTYCPLQKSAPEGLSQCALQLMLASAMHPKSQSKLTWV